MKFFVSVFSGCTHLSVEFYLSNILSFLEIVWFLFRFAYLYTLAVLHFVSFFFKYIESTYIIWEFQYLKFLRPDIAGLLFALAHSAIFSCSSWVVTVNSYFLEFYQWGFFEIKSKFLRRGNTFISCLMTNQPGTLDSQLGVVWLTQVLSIQAADFFREACG